MWRVCVLGLLAIGSAAAASIGEVVVIGGQAADLALDESRGVLYVANFTAARIDILGLADRSLRSSMHVAAGPSALALSRDGRYLVAAHFGNPQPPAAPANALTIVDLASGGRQTLALANPPLGVAFGADGRAMIATTAEFLLLDPSSGRTELIDTVANATASSLPAPAGTPPLQIVGASLAASADGRWIFGLADTLRFAYDVSSGQLNLTNYTATPPLGPRVVSVASDGSYYAAGWGVFDRRGFLQAQFAAAAGLAAVGSHAIDSAAGLLYSQIPRAPLDPAAAPVLTIHEADNLAIRERLNLPENLSGRALLNRAGDTLYAVSESGVVVVPVGSLDQYHRLAADREDLVFRGSFCQPGAITKTLVIRDPGGGRTAFSLSSDLANVRISPSSGRTPASIQITVDPRAFQDRRGTISGSLRITSPDAVNLISPVRLLVHTDRPDERGSFTDIPGTLADLLADPVRDRFYVLRQDRNQVLVFDASAMVPLATLRTGNTPTRMAQTRDRKYLLIGHEDSQLIYVYDLDTFQQSLPIVMPAGHYPHSIAASTTALLAASRVAGGPNTIDRIDFPSRTASPLPSLGVFQNSTHADTILTANPAGSAILAVSADGLVMRYDAAADSFTVSRKLAASLSGVAAALSTGQFVAGNRLLNAALVPAATFDGSALASGFTVSDGAGVRVTAPSASPGTGMVERIDLSTGQSLRAMRLAEQPLVTGGTSVFTRTLAALSNRNALVALTTSGFTALSPDFDLAVAPPFIREVVNAADMTSAVAEGSLIAVFGSNLNPTNVATREIPLPTAIGESCLTVNGAPIPMLFASPTQINAQMPFHVDGRAVLTLYTPGSISDDYYLDLLPAAPAIFRGAAAGPLTGLATVIKAANQQVVTGSNPIHPGDEILIYATGLGPTDPEIEAGLAPPSSPPATTLLVPEVRLGGAPLTVSFAGLSPGQPGVYEIRARAPSSVIPGLEIPLTITQAGVATSVPVRVVD